MPQAGTMKATETCHGSSCQSARAAQPTETRSIPSTSGSREPKRRPRSPPTGPAISIEPGRGQDPQPGHGHRRPEAVGGQRSEVRRQSARELGLFAAAALLFLAWGRVELRVREPRVDMRMLARRPVLFTNLTAMISGGRAP